MTRILTRAGAAGAAAAMGLMLFGCTTTASDADAGNTSEPGALTPLKVLVAPINNEPVYYAIDNGIFEEHGLEVEAIPGGALPAQVVPQIISGEVDISMIGGATLVAAVAEGLPVRGVFPNSGAFPQAEPSNGFFVAADSPYEGYGDLDGTTLAMPGLNEVPHLATMLAIQANGGDPSTVNFLEMPLPNINEAVGNGQIDGAVNVGSFYSAALDAGFRSFGSPSNDYLDGTPTTQFFTTTDWIAENEDTLERFTAALTETNEYLNTDSEAIRDIQRQYTELPEEVIATALLQTYWTSYSAEGLQRLIDAMAEFDFISTVPTLDELLWSGAPIE
ncbi:ABC transporter substrate-binding protein [Microbacterium sp. 18062]|uniref:ABC transporter substrate-binding protein n=1 Tax=Microbacterium sp. 18062 TaxID=2681410 RepID=UPI00135A1493|nr:ABC transporter substrate-binding protein [Microbacterium sp. 18062]